VTGRRSRPRRSLPQLELNALALMLTTVTTGVVGVVFWTAAARLYPPSEVGRASAILSTATLLGAAANLNLGNVYLRFLPGAGVRSRSFVAKGYLAVIAISVVLGVAFLPSAAAGRLLLNTFDRITFPVLVVALSLFMMQDLLLVALRAARWVAVENITFALVKIGLLLALAGVTHRMGIVLAWGLPAVVAVLAIGLILLGPVLSNRAKAARFESTQLPSVRELSGFVAAESVTGLVTYVVPLLLPLIVVARLGTAANAYLAIPWMIIEALNLLIWNVAGSLIVEAAHDEAQSVALVRRSIKLSALIGGAGVVFLLVAAPTLLRVLGGAYADQGGDLVRIMALALPFTIIVTSYNSLARIRRQMGRVVLMQLSTAALVIGLTFALIGHVGIRGVGIAYLCGEGAVAMLVLAPLLRGLRIRENSTPAAPSTPAAEALAVHATTVGSD
jgi:O-antigen/teichoic acid export membrane protein